MLENERFRNAGGLGNLLGGGVLKPFIPKQLQRHIGNVLAAGNHKRNEWVGLMSAANNPG